MRRLSLIGLLAALSAWTTSGFAQTTSAKLSYQVVGHGSFDEAVRQMQTGKLRQVSIHVKLEQPSTDLRCDQYRTFLSGSARAGVALGPHCDANGDVVVVVTDRNLLFVKGTGVDGKPINLPAELKVDFEYVATAGTLGGGGAAINQSGWCWKSHCINQVDILTGEEHPYSPAQVRVVPRDKRVNVEADGTCWKLTSKENVEDVRVDAWITESNTQIESNFPAGPIICTATQADRPPVLKPRKEPSCRNEYPVDCGDYCCRSGAYCSNGECAFPPVPEPPPAAAPEVPALDYSGSGSSFDWSCLWPANVSYADFIIGLAYYRFPDRYLFPKKHYGGIFMGGSWDYEWVLLDGRISGSLGPEGDGDGMFHASATVGLAPHFGNEGQLVPYLGPIAAGWATGKDGSGSALEGGGGIRYHFDGGGGMDGLFFVDVATPLGNCCGKAPTAFTLGFGIGAKDKH